MNTLGRPEYILHLPSVPAGPYAPRKKPETKKQRRFHHDHAGFLSAVDTDAR